MYSFGEKHPIVFQIILTTVSFLAAGIIVAATSLYMHPDLCSSVARVVVAAALLVIYRRAFKGQNHFRNLKIGTISEISRSCSRFCCFRCGTFSIILVREWLSGELITSLKARLQQSLRHSLRKCSSEAYSSTISRRKGMTISAVYSFLPLCLRQCI